MIEPKGRLSMDMDELSRRIAEGFRKGALEDQETLKRLKHFVPGQHLDGSHLENDEERHLDVRDEDDDAG
jgi:hypothetical protein